MRALYDAPLEHRRNASEARSGTRTETSRYGRIGGDHVESRPQCGAAIADLPRFLGHAYRHRSTGYSLGYRSRSFRITSLIVFARSDDYFLGRLAFARPRSLGEGDRARNSAKGKVADVITYTSLFETFPFPTPTAEHSGGNFRSGEGTG